MSKIMNETYSTEVRERVAHHSHALYAEGFSYPEERLDAAMDVAVSLGMGLEACERTQATAGTHRGPSQVELEASWALLSSARSPSAHG